MGSSFITSIASKKLSKPSFDPLTINHDIEYVANKLGISVQELNSYMYLPKKTYRDYKSQEQIYDIGSKILKFLKIEKGGKR